MILALLAGAEAPPADLPPCPTAEDQPDVVKLMQRTERVLEGRSAISVMTMTINTPAYERSVKMKLWSKGRDFALVRVLEGGPRETGMMTLKREKQLWNYLPQAGRVMKLPSGMMGDSWMGSDFTNDDLPGRTGEPGHAQRIRQRVVRSLRAVGALRSLSIDATAV